jgi:quinol-cytochrome oxidoreductase complex cytochrome b subunit
MNAELLWKAVLAGMLFGIWPLLIKASGLNAGTVTVLGSGLMILFVMPFALANGISLGESKWWWLIFVMSSMTAVACLTFNGIMAEAKPSSAGLLFIIMLVMQTVAPAVYHSIVNQHLSIRTLAGFITAITACILLSKK